MKALATILALLACVTTLGACKMLERLEKSAQPNAAASTRAASTGAPSSEEANDSLLADKLDAYIYCMNYETRSAFSAKEGYLRRVDAVKGPTGKENGLSVPELNPAECFERIDQAKTKQPSLPDVEASAAKYASALSALAALTKQAHDYYDQKEFKDDKFAKGIALHKPLLAAFDAFEQADKPFEAQVSTLNDALSERRLARLKSDPTQVLPYDIAQSLDDAKKLVHFAEVDSLEQVNLPGLTAAVTTYEEALAALSSYADAHHAEAEKVAFLSGFRSAASDFLKAAKELVRRKRDKKGYQGETLPPEMIDGHPANVLAKYNDMINRSNDLGYH
ncbi:MAG TPA: DUF3829 domain-containing protein [Polyangiaceae bacterium]|nr:DUF3829 domain-containing protein [Polyangiaceae bacterium]